MLVSTTLSSTAGDCAVTIIAKPGDPGLAPPVTRQDELSRRRLYPKITLYQLLFKYYHVIGLFK